MTRKTCTDHSHVDTVLKSVCHELQLLHNSPWSSSASASLNPKRFYRTINLFLKENGITLENLQMTRNKMPRTRATSMCCKLKQPPLSPTNDFIYRLRTRRHTGYANHFIDTSGDDDSNHVKPMRELRSSKVIVQQTKESDLWDSGRPKRRCKQKRPTADERLVFDNRNYYKVEVMTNKLRSVREKKVKSPIVSEESEDDKVYGFHKKLRKKRYSEITRLNNEADNFLFPHKDDSSSDETDVTEPSTNHKENNKLKLIKKEPDEVSLCSNSSESSAQKKKRRLTQAEAFILDNQKYYKFETPVSRLRYQGSYLSPVTTKNNGECGVKNVKPAKENDEQKSGLKLDELKFSFEVVPQSEPWYDTFQRQDKGQECYTCYNYTSGYKPFLLPYEMGPLPPLNPRVCYYAYNQIKKEILGDTGPSTSEACSTPDTSNTDTNKTDYNSSTCEDTKSSEDVSMDVFPQKIFRKSRRRKLLSCKNPRKSPRQHASTLAILSSLIHQRKRREFNKFKNLSVITEEAEADPDYEVLTKSIDDMLTTSYDDINLTDNSFGEDINIDVRCKVNAVECLDDYLSGGVYNNSQRKEKTNSVGRKPVRKKKKNRTGWPNKNRRPAFRKDGSNSGDGTETSIKNSRISSRIELEENSSDNNINKRKINNKLANGDVQVNKFNGEICFKNIGMPRRKERRESSSDNCAEVVIPSVGDKIDCVNVDLAKWENAEKLLSAKIRCENINNDILFQPIVRVQKLDSNVVEEKCIEKQFHVVNTTTKLRGRPRRMPASPKSPRMLRRPRGLSF